MGRLLCWLLVIGSIAAGIAWYLSGPDRLQAAVTTGLTGDPVHGAEVFAIAGCASCHRAPDVAVVAGALPVLAGGQRILSDFGTFLVPTISPSSEGIAAWSDADLMNAIMRGVAPDGSHLYPAFPYDAYAKATKQEIADLIAYLRTLPADATPSQPHELGFPFSIRRAVGLWKVLFRSDDWVLADAQTPQPGQPGK